MDIRIRAETVEVSQNVNRAVVDMQLIFTEPPNNEVRVYITNALVADMLRQIREQKP